LAEGTAKRGRGHSRTNHRPSSMARVLATCAAILGCLAAGFLGAGSRGATFGLPAGSVDRRPGLVRGGVSAATRAALGADGRASSRRGRPVALAGLAIAAAAVLLARDTRRCRLPGGAARTPLRYTTQTITPSLTWLKAGFSLGPGEIRVVCLAGCDVCVGKTSSGKSFAVGDKAPPTGISFAAGAEMQGDLLIEPQYGNAFNVFTGLPEGDWCPSPPFIGGLVGAFMGGPQAVSVFETREGIFGGEIEVLVDTNAKRAYEADYWKGILDAQGKDDGTYY